MKKKGIALLALLLCLGGRPPMVLAEETETELEEVTVEEAQDEVTDEVTEEEKASSDNAEETAAEEIIEEAVQEESAEKETAEEQKQPRSDYEVLPTEHGTVSVTSCTKDLFHQGNCADCWKISCTPDEGYRVGSVKAQNPVGIEIDLIQDDENTYYAAKGVFLTIEAVFEEKLYPLYVNPDVKQNVTFMIDGEPVTQAKPGQTVQAAIELELNEFVRSVHVCDHKNGQYSAELISETFFKQVYQFTMIDDEVRLDLDITTDGTPYWDENCNIHRIEHAEKINSSKNLTLTTGWYIVNGNVTIDKRVEIDGDVNIILPDFITFTCEDGIHNREGNSLTIWAQAVGDGHLDAQNPGRDKAGIGGNKNENGGTFTLHRGWVKSEAGLDAAGLGGGYSGDGGNIRVYGGHLHAHSNDNSAGIGGGEYGSGGTIIIYGGDVYGEGDYSCWSDLFHSAGAGIGGGEKGSGGYIEINGGTVKGLGGKSGAGAGAGIGGGSKGDGGTIVINEGDITGTSENAAAGIGGGYNSSAGSITINGGIIHGSSSKGAGIGNGLNGTGGHIETNGGTIYASSSHDAGIGGAWDQYSWRKYRLLDGGLGLLDIFGGTIIAHSDAETAIMYADTYIESDMVVLGAEGLNKHAPLNSWKDITIYRAN